MDLEINGKIITEDIETILYTLKEEIGGRYLDYIKSDNDNVKITCPYHKDGHERKPSCHVYTRTDNPDVVYGTVHCFTCGKKVQLYSLIGFCFGEDDEFGKNWLSERFGDVLLVDDFTLPSIDLNECNKEREYIDESVLDKYRYLHPYQFKRGLTESVIRRFEVGWNSITNSITFPVRDEFGGLVGVTERSVDSKRFYIPSNMDKPVYLLNYIKQDNIKNVYVCESQINALTLWSWGYPAVALFGTGSYKQYEILKHSGIRGYVLCFDGDMAGDKGAERFKSAINFDNKSAIIAQKKIPRGKDVNDLTKEEFDKLDLIIF